MSTRRLDRRHPTRNNLTMLRSVRLSSAVASAVGAQARAISATPRAALDFDLSEEQRALEDMAQQFAREVIMPVAGDHDKTGEFPWEIVRSLSFLSLNTQQQQQHKHNTQHTHTRLHTHTHHTHTHTHTHPLHPYTQPSPGPLCGLVSLPFFLLTIFLRSTDQAGSCSWAYEPAHPRGVWRSCSRCC